MKSSKRKRVNTQEYQETNQQQISTLDTNTPFYKYVNENQFVDPCLNAFNSQYQPYASMPPPLTIPYHASTSSNILPALSLAIQNQQNYQVQNHLYTNDSKLNDISNFGAHNQYQLYQNHNAIEANNYFMNNSYDNKNSAANNIQPLNGCNNTKSSATNTIKYLTTLDHHLLNQKNNIVAARASSYYCLTPASSTTSLNDITLIANNNNNNSRYVGKQLNAPTVIDDLNRSSVSTSSLQNLLNDSTSSVCTTATTQSNYETQSNKTAKSSNSKKRIRTTTQQQQSEEAEHLAKTENNNMMASNNNSKPNIVRRRGRPPKTAITANTKKADESSKPIESETPLLSSTSEATEKMTSNKENNNSSSTSSNTKLTRHNTIDNSSLAAAASSSSSANPTKLIKSLITKSSSNSNLQKNKVTKESCIAVTPAINVAASVPPPLTETTNKSTAATQPKLPEENLVEAKKQDLLNNAILFYENYNAIKLDMLHNDLMRPFLNNYGSLSTIPSNQAELDAIKNQLILMNTPMPHLNWANRSDLWKIMRLKDIQYKHDYFYLKRHTGIEPQMRAILMDWMTEISYAYRLHRETFHLSIEYMDRFMTCTKHQIRVDRLQLIGITSLFLAAKVEEIYPPKLKDFASHMENYAGASNEETIQQFELFMLKSLSWKISPVTANTWLMTFLQIASINYHLFIDQQQQQQQQQDQDNLSKVYNTHIVMPLTIYKNANFNLKDYLQQSATTNKFSNQQQLFFLNNYMKSITLLDLCIFDLESLKYSYSVLAASCLYHMVSLPQSSLSTCSISNQDKHFFIQQCTGYKLYELDSCIKWMYPYAEVCKDILTSEKMTSIKQFTNVDADDSHNIQLYYQNLELLKEAQSRKTPCKFNSTQNLNVLLTPPDSHRKYSSSSASTTTLSADSILSNTTILSTPSIPSQAK